MDGGGGDSVGSLVAAILVIIVPLAAVATIAMAIVQAVKSAFWIRARVHRRRLCSWVGDSQLSALLRVATGGESHLGASIGFSTPAWAFLNQEGEVLFRKLKAGIDIVLEFPVKKEHKDLYDYLTQAVKEDAQYWKEHSEDALNIPERDDKQRAAKLDVARKAAEARQRVTTFVHHRIDTLQAHTEEQWVWWNQICAVSLSVVILWWLSGGLIDQWAEKFTNLKAFVDYYTKLPVRLAVSVLGSLVAPFAKDVMSTLTGLRTKS